MQHLIFLVDRDVSFSILVAAECEGLGYLVQTLNSPEDVVRHAERLRPSLFLINAHERANDGSRWYDLLRNNRRLLHTPRIVLSDCGSDEECVHFLEGGADDYIAKPISVRELGLRVRAILDSPRRRSAPRVRIGSLEVDAAGMIAWVDGKPITLTAREFRLLEYLARNPGRPVAREELLQEVYPDSTSAGLRTVDTHVCRLREKVEPIPDHPIYIHTIHKLGYCLSLP